MSVAADYYGGSIQLYAGEMGYFECTPILLSVVACHVILEPEVRTIEGAVLDKKSNFDHA